jgi:predicted transposase YbfD/YdcC
VVAQRAVGEKTSEIPELPRLLEPLPLQGAVITVDAMNTQ